MGREREVWVVGCGDEGRRRTVAAIFARYRVVAIGPSDSFEVIEAKFNAGRAAGRKPKPRPLTSLRRFIQEADDCAQPGDIVILREGRRGIRDLGVLGPYLHDPEFGVASWDLGHVRSVNWLELSQGKQNGLEGCLGKDFAIDRFGRLADHQTELCRQVRGLVSRAGVVAPSDVPKKAVSLDSDEFVERIRSEVSCSELIVGDKLEEVIEIAKKFGIEEGDYPRLEADSIAMVLVPLLNALGVDLRRIRVEVPISVLGAADGPARRVDLVVFENSGIEEPVLMMEVKRRWSGLDWARDQMGQYMEQAGLPDMVNVVTDGSEFLVENLPERDLARSEPAEISLRWPTESGAVALARLADHLASSLDPS